MPLVTPGVHDNNVAAAWTAFLLREDDSPRTLMDHVMNGLAGGALAGAGADAVHWIYRKVSPPQGSAPSAALPWTRRGALIGCGVSVFAFVVKKLVSPRSAERLQQAETRGGLPSELMADPWATNGRKL